MRRLTHTRSTRVQYSYNPGEEIPLAGIGPKLAATDEIPTAILTNGSPPTPERFATRSLKTQTSKLRERCRALHLYSILGVLGQRTGGQYLAVASMPQLYPGSSTLPLMSNQKKIKIFKLVCFPMCRKGDSLWLPSLLIELFHAGSTTTWAVATSRDQRTGELRFVLIEGAARGGLWAGSCVLSTCRQAEVDDEGTGPQAGASQPESNAPRSAPWQSYISSRRC